MPPAILSGELYLAYVHSLTNPQICTKFGANQSSHLTASQTFEFVTPYPPNAPWGIEGRLVFSLCPIPDESAEVNQSWCQSDSFPIFFNCWPSKTPQVPPVVSRGAICLAYIHSHMNLHMCAKFNTIRPSCLVAFPEFVLRLVRLFAAVRAKKQHLYIKIIIPARTCRHQRH